MARLALAFVIVVTILGMAPLAVLGQKEPAQAPVRERTVPKQLETGVLPSSGVAAAAATGAPSVQNRYIVVTRDDVSDPLDVAKPAAGAAGADAAAVGEIVPTHVYRYALKGFAAQMSPAAVTRLRQDPRVAAVVPDAIVYATGEVPTGVDRSDADRNVTAGINGADQRVDVDVAVIDSGVQPHADLNLVAVADCTGTGTADDHGHGTHVAGTVGALDNGVGVVGVAPGARIWGIRVLTNDPATGRATGSRSQIICGLDVARHYAVDQPNDQFGDIEVANLSIGGDGTDSVCPTTSDPYHQAYCNLVNAGVTTVVAAGNDDENASATVPAAYDEVITVSALADSDGIRGGIGANTWAGFDDAFASFSNFGQDVDIAAPGVDIRSTLRTGGYGEMSGTSMASPHVAGAAAIYLARNSALSPAQVRSLILFARENVTIPGDPDVISEGILNLNDRTSSPARPANDNFANAARITGFPFSDERDTLDAIKERTDPAMSCATSAGAGVWYSFSTSGGRQVEIDTAGSSYDTVLAVYTGGPDGFTPVACNDDNGGVQSRVAFRALINVTYHVLVAAFDSNRGGQLAVHASLVDSTAPPPAVLVLTEREADAHVKARTLFYDPAGNGGSFQIQANVSDPESGIASVRFPVVFGGDAALRSAAPFRATYAWARGATFSGNRVAIVTNNVGLTKQEFFTVTADRTNPRAAITAPRPGARVTRATAVAVNASDVGAGVAQVDVRYCPGRACAFASGTVVGTDRVAPYSVAWSRLPVNGTYTLVTKVTDYVGHETLATATVEVVRAAGAGAAPAAAEGTSAPAQSPRVAADVETAAPTASLSVPAAGGPLAGRAVLVAKVKHAGSAIEQVTFEARRAGTQAWITLDRVQAAPFRTALDTTTLRDGTYQLRAVAIDRNGSQGVSDPVRVEVANRAAEGTQRPAPAARG